MKRKPTLRESVKDRGGKIVESEVDSHLVSFLF